MLASIGRHSAAAVIQRQKCDELELLPAPAPGLPRGPQVRAANRGAIAMR